MKTENSRITIHMVSSLDGFIAKKTIVFRGLTPPAIMTKELKGRTPKSFLKR